MNKRPTSITVVSWVLIFQGCCALAVLFDPRIHERMAHGTLPILSQYGVFGISILIFFICGITMLFGKNWARSLWLCWTIIANTISVIYSITSSYQVGTVLSSILPGIILNVIIAFYLFRSKANKYFVKVN